VRTDPGTIVGTVAYMSPEQARGQDVDARTDVWSLGVTLYEMLAGRSPFAASSSTDVLAAILDREPAPLARFDPDVPPELQRIISKALRKDRGQRYQTARDVLLDLQTLRDDLHSHGRLGSAAVTPITREPARSRPGPAVAPVPRRTRRMWTAMAGTALALGVGLGVWAWRTGRFAPTPVAPTSGTAQRNLTRLTFGPGLQTDVTFSPDGRLIAYASDRAGNFDIWVQSVSGGDAVQVTKSSTHETQPDWSPDGSTMVFHSDRGNGGIFVVPVLGGTEQQLTAFGSRPTWSPDGSEIFFLVGPALGSSWGDASLYVVPASGGRPQQLLFDFLQGGSWYWIDSHPDGRISALGSHRQRGFGFFTLSRDGRDAIVSRHASNFPIRWSLTEIAPSWFRWNPAGTALVIESRSHGVQNLWRVRVDPKTLAWLSADRLTTGPGRDTALAIASDGSRVAFSTQTESARVWAFPFERARGPLGEGKPVSEEGGQVLYSDLSADGRMLVYSLVRSGSKRTELWTIDLDTGTSQLVVSDVGLGGAGACWSPDGSALAFTQQRQEQDGKRTAFAVAVRRPGEPEQLLNNWSAEYSQMCSQWTPDGHGIIGPYQRPALTGWAALALWNTSRIAADAPEKVLYAEPGAHIWQGRYSPDGRWLSFVVERAGVQDHLIMLIAPAAGGSSRDWRRIAIEHRGADKPRWASDGRTLYFVSPGHAAYLNLWGVHIDPKRGHPVGRPFVITHFDTPSFRISPHVERSDIGIANRRAVLTMVSVTGSIWMLDNVDK
jgi:Tol biopolymer transport system component